MREELIKLRDYALELCFPKMRVDENPRLHEIYDNWLDYEYVNGELHFLGDYDGNCCGDEWIVMSNDGEYSSLNDIVELGLDKYNIFVESGVYNYDTPVAFDVPVTIVGDENNPPVINCKSGYRWCNINLREHTGVECSIKNIKMQGNQSVTQYGFHIQVGGNKVVIDNCYFDKIWSLYNGQAVRLTYCTEGSDIEVKNCVFTNNKTTGYGHIFGTLIVGGELISNLKVHNCLFNNLTPSRTNAKRGANGSAILISNEDYSTTVPVIGNAVAYCNTYVNPSIDYNYRISESECED